MRFLRNLSIRSKLTLITMITSVTALLVASGVFITKDLVTLRREMLEAATVSADLVGSNSTAALSFQNPADAREVLSALRANPSIDAAWIFTPDGSVFATYVRAGAEQAPQSPQDLAARPGYKLEGQAFVVSRPISLDGKRIGTVALRANDHEMQERIHDYCKVIGLILLAASIAAFILVTRLQRVVSGPILHLTETARAVTSGRNYGLRATADGEDELGVLVQCFNQMLSEIQERDQQLQTHRDHLEEEVALRTQELTGVNAELADQKRAMDCHAIVAITDPSGRITYVNDLFCRISKFSREELIGQNHRIINSGVHPRSYFVDIWRTITAGNIWHGEICNRAKDGSLYWTDSTIVPFKDAAGKITQYVAVRADITGLKLAEQDLKLARDAAESANRAKSAFLANMSHEIRTPMTAIVGYADMMLEPDQTLSDRQDCLQIIRRNAGHLLDLINDILDLSKIEADKMTVERISVDLPRLTAEVASLMRPRATDKSLGFSVTFADPLPATILTDPLRLRQILVNLLGNAVKFTSTGHVSLHVSFEDDADTTGCSRIRFAISDTGIGMSAEQISRLFQAFTQADQSMTRRFGGTGLGLAISQRLATLLGGRISVRSTLGSGSSFTVEIDGGPLRECQLLHGVSESILGSVAQSQPFPASLQISGRILFAEDGLDNQRLIALHLRKAGAEVVIAENGRIAVELATREMFDLVLMDMQMPVLDGYGAASKLRKLGYKRPIVALTAHAMADDRAKCIAAGCTDYLTKPIDRQTLLRTVKDHLDRSRGLPAEALERAAAPESSVQQSQSHSSAYADDADMKELIVEYVRRLPVEVARMQAHLSAGEIEPLRRVAHQLKGSGGGYGFSEVTRLAGAADLAIKQGADLESVRRQVDDLVEYIRAISDYDGALENANASDRSSH